MEGHVRVDYLRFEIGQLAKDLGKADSTCGLCPEHVAFKPELCSGSCGPGYVWVPVELEPVLKIAYRSNQP